VEQRVRHFALPARAREPDGLAKQRIEVPIGNAEREQLLAPLVQPCLEFPLGPHAGACCVDFFVKRAQPLSAAAERRKGLFLVVRASTPRSVPRLSR
jgi:hypothetical protein